MLCSQTRLLEIALNQIMFEERKCNGCLDYVQWQFFFSEWSVCYVFDTGGDLDGLWNNKNNPKHTKHFMKTSGSEGTGSTRNHKTPQQSAVQQQKALTEHIRAELRPQQPCCPAVNSCYYIILCCVNYIFTSEEWISHSLSSLATPNRLFS